MQLSRWLGHLVARALAASMDVRSMVHMARRFIRNYDIHERTGFPPNFPVPNQDAAARIVSDVQENDQLLDFIALLITMQDTGVGGITYKVPHLREIMREIKKIGLLFDPGTQMFFEDPRVRRSRNWSVLRENEEYIFTFLVVDIVGSTNLVRHYPDDVMQAVYEDLREIARRSVELHNGRMWDWEGDGGVAAFYFSNKNNNAVISAMEITHEMYLYNLISPRLDRPLQVRLAVHSGPCEYRHDIGDMKNDTLKKLVEMEKAHTLPNSVTVSSSVYQMLSQLLAEQMTPVSQNSAVTLYRYMLEWEG
jgi:class 3 adenylate cyclase